MWQQQADIPAGWLNLDPRVNWVIDTLRQYRGEKFLLICAHADTAQMLSSHLSERVGLRSAVFHEGLSIIERDRAAAYFAESEPGAQVLVCSEIGSEGRNFQFAHHLLMFDLPSHPDLLEQRIGRLDRIGQTQDIQIHLGYFANSPQEIIYRLYHQVLDAFLHPCTTGATLFARFAERIDRLLSDFPVQQSSLAELVDEMTASHRQLSQQLEQGRDRLLELNSYRADEADYVRRAIIRLESDPRLPEFLEIACSQFGVDLEVHGADSYIMHPGTHMLVDHFPGLPADGLTLTLSRATALTREDWQFMSWEHPVTRGIMDLILEDHHGNTTLAIIRHSDLPAGSLLLECQFILEGMAPRRLQLARFLPPTPVRLVIDSQGQDHSAQLPAEELTLLSAELDKTTRNKILRARQGELRRMLADAETVVQQPARDILEQANRAMRSLLDNDIARLQHLARINPNVRESEVEQLLEQREALSEHIRQVQPRLDAVRLLITS